MARLDPVVAGDVNVTRSRTLTEFGTLADGTGEDVATIVAHVWRGDIDPVELVCDVDDAEDCAFTIDFGDETGWLAQRPSAGVWLVEYQATFDDGTVLTAPAVWPDEIIVRGDHDPAEE
ncbi:MAG TPA: hypothetical protein VGK49_04490 [Ilumatobacteraceae bacterium]